MRIHDTARRLAREVYVERRLFEIVGAWSADEARPEAVVAFATQSRHHAWRADLLAAHQPRLHDLDLSSSAPDPALVAALDALAATKGTVERLAVLVEVVLPALLVDHEAHLSSADPVSDAPVARVLRIVIADDEVDWRAATTLLRVVVGPEREAEVRAAARQSELTGLLAQARSQI